MHFLLLVLIPEGTKKAKAYIKNAMEPFCEELETKPYKEFISLKELKDCCSSSGIELADPKVDPEGSEVLSAIAAYHGGKAGFDKKENKHFYLSTYNPNGEWDWYRVGGRWDGWIVDNEQSSNNGFNFDKVHETIENNSCTVKELTDDNIPNSILVDDKWYSRDNSKNWHKKVKKLFEEYKNFLAVAVDCHT